MDPVDIAKLTIGQFAFLIALFLPGFVSIKSDRLVHPGDDLKAPELIVEAFGYSVINAGVLIWPIVVVFRELARPHPSVPVLWPLGVLICVVAPMIWPPLLRGAQRLGAKRGWLLGSYVFPWDDFFTRRDPCWIVVHLPDGATIGGYMGTKSMASLAPQSGHLYIEELWRLDDGGGFVAPVAASKGALLRPQDYHWVELFVDKETA